MKRYLIRKEIDVQEASQDVAEQKLGHPVINKKKSKDGYLVCDSDTLKWDWLHKQDFRATPFDSDIEKIIEYEKELSGWQRTFLMYTKNNPNISLDEKQITYNINRHLRHLSQSIKKLISINTITDIKL